MTTWVAVKKTSGETTAKASDNGSGERGENPEIIACVREYAARRSGKVAVSSTSLSLTELKAKIAHSHSPLVESVARRFVGSGEPFDDLVQEGFLGLLSALDHYDPERTVSPGSVKRIKFSTYATHFIAGSIRHFLRDRGKIIKEPAWLHEVSAKVTRATDELTVQLGRAPRTEEIAQALNLTGEAVEEILSTRQTFQVSAFGSSTEDGGTMAVGLVDPEKIRSDKPQTLQLPIEDRIVLENAVLKLKELEQRVLWEFFYQDHSQTEIAKKFGISCNYVSHILKNSTQKLRRILGEAEVRDRARAVRTASDTPAAITCTTTGLFEVGHTMARLSEELSRSARDNRPCALLYISVAGMPDRGLKRETLLHELGSTLRSALRRVDIAGRSESSPDDFVVLLPQVGETAAQSMATRLENILMATGAAVGEKLIIRIGLAAFPTAGRSVRELLQRAQGNNRRDGGLPSMIASDFKSAAAFVGAAIAATVAR